jgi:hypothetical protein
LLELQTSNHLVHKDNTTWLSIFGDQGLEQCIFGKFWLVRCCNFYIMTDSVRTLLALTKVEMAPIVFKMHHYIISVVAREDVFGLKDAWSAFSLPLRLLLEQHEEQENKKVGQHGSRSCIDTPCPTVLLSCLLAMIHSIPTAGER